MRKPLNIYSYSNFIQPINEDLAPLKEALLAACGKKIRRIDRLTQLALIGSFQCKGNQTLDENTGLYLSSRYGSLNNIQSVLKEIYQQGEIPRPLSFINSVSNSACFYLAEQLGILTNNQFFTRDNFALAAAFNLASLDLELGHVDAAMVGLVSEAAALLDIHRERLNIDKHYAIAEGSHWFLLAHEHNDLKPLAQVEDIIESVDETDLQAYIEKAYSQFDGETLICFNRRVSTDQCPQWLAKLPRQDFLPKNARHEIDDAMQLCGFLQYCEEKKENSFYSKTNQQLLYLDASTVGETTPHSLWSILAVRSLSNGL